LAGSGPFLPRKPLVGVPSEAKLFARSRESFATSSVKITARAAGRTGAIGKAMGFVVGAHQCESGVRTNGAHRDGLAAQILEGPRSARGTFAEWQARPRREPSERRRHQAIRRGCRRDFRSGRDPRCPVIHGALARERKGRAVPLCIRPGASAPSPPWLYPQNRRSTDAESPRR